MSLIHVVTYFLDLVARPNGLAFSGGDLVRLLHSGRFIVLVCAIIVVVVYNILIVRRRSVRTEDVRHIHPRVLRIGFQVERSCQRMNRRDSREIRYFLLYYRYFLFILDRYTGRSRQEKLNYAAVGITRTMTEFVNEHARNK